MPIPETLAKASVTLLFNGARTRTVMETVSPGTNGCPGFGSTTTMLGSLTSPDALFAGASLLANDGIAIDTPNARATQTARR